MKKISRSAVQNIGILLVDSFHFLALFIIGCTVLWSATYEYYQMIERGYAPLKDIFLLFIYLELGAMVGIYLKTKKLPVQMLIFIAITALSRHLVIDVQHVSENFHLALLVVIAAAILLLSLSLLILAYAENKYGKSEDRIE